MIVIRRIDGTWRRTLLAVLLVLACLTTGPAPGSLPAAEASFDVRHKERSRYHEDTDSHDTTSILTEAKLFGEFEFGEVWQARLEGAIQNQTLEGPLAQSLIAADATLITPRLTYSSGTFKARGTLVFVEIDPQPSVYPPSGRDESLVLPALDLTWSRQGTELMLGAWREFDLFPLPDSTYTPVVYLTVYAGLNQALGNRWSLGGQVGTTAREIPDNLPQDRQEAELTLRRDNPLGASDEGVWRNSSLSLVTWHYTLNGEDTNFLKWRNAFRFTSGKVSHALDHTLTFTDTYVVYVNGKTPRSIVEVDKAQNDLQQRAEYTAWSRIGDSAWFWRAGGNLEQSLRQDAFREFEIKAGITRTL